MSSLDDDEIGCRAGGLRPRSCGGGRFDVSASRGRLRASESTGAAARDKNGFGSWATGALLGFLESGTDARGFAGRPREAGSWREDLPDAFVDWLRPVDVRIDGGITGRRDMILLCAEP
jgi:hypothetical protein